MHRPKEVTQRLGVSSATLRRWSDTFSSYLSPSAGRSVNATGGSTQRRYTDQDIAVFERVKGLLDAGNTYEETERKLLDPDVVVPDNHPVPLTEPTTSGSLVALEAYRDAIAGKDQTIEALRETIHFQNILLEELRERSRQASISPVLPAMTLRERLDWLIRGRMIDQRKKRLDALDGQSQRSLPIHEPA